MIGSGKVIQRVLTFGGSELCKVGREHHFDLGEAWEDAKIIRIERDEDCWAVTVQIGSEND